LIDRWAAKKKIKIKHPQEKCDLPSPYLILRRFPMAARSHRPSAGGDVGDEGENDWMRRWIPKVDGWVEIVLTHT
jgi:hypothetical protein